MTFPRRSFLKLTAGAVSLLATPRFARAQAYPSRPVRIIVGFGPGSAPDILARLIGQWLTDRLGGPFIVENRPGAGSNIATEAVVRAPPNGYTLLLASPGSAINGVFYGNLNYDFHRDIVPIAGISREPLAMEVHPSFPATSVPEFIAYAKANPGKLSYASVGPGTSLHLATELFKMMAGVDLVHVPYRSSAAAWTDLLGQQVQMMIGPLTSSIEYVRTGRLRVLAMTGAARSRALPDSPLMSDFLPGYEASVWYGLCAPRYTSADIVDRLNREIGAGLADAKLKTQLEELGSFPFVTSPAELGKHIADETEKWGKVIKAAGLKPD
jgi:tripartite-type tricarboxylate transporter receptor subunit TctC